MTGNFETLRQRVENIMGSTVEPRISGMAFHQVAGFERGPIVIVRVPRSWTGPHMLVPHKHFYSRNSVGKYPLDVREIGNLFAASAELEGRARRFRDERLGRIIAGDTPVVLAPRPKAVVHLIPLTHDLSFRLDLQALAERATTMQPMSMGRNMTWRFNLDGFVTYAGPETGPQRSYAQAFRNGSFEAVTSLSLHDSRTPHGLKALKIEKEVCDVTRAFLSILRDAGLAAPVALLIALLDVRGTCIYYGSVDEDQREIIDRVCFAKQQRFATMQYDRGRNGLISYGLSDPRKHLVGNMWTNCAWLRCAQCLVEFEHVAIGASKIALFSQFYDKRCWRSDCDTVRRFHRVARSHIKDRRKAACPADQKGRDVRTLDASGTSRPKARTRFHPTEGPFAKYFKTMTNLSCVTTKHYPTCRFRSPSKRLHSQAI